MRVSLDIRLTPFLPSSYHIQGERTIKMPPPVLATPTRAAETY
nr:MAG TPA: hypothetical protein [Caudoviricetes sp.]DAW37561.1 MAG TPA: hypothetical protein [Caudoviricetes sp.]